MSKETHWTKRIIPLRDRVAAIIRSFWYLRTFMILLILAILISALILTIVERDLQPKNGVAPVKNYGEAIHLSLATAASINTGNIGAISTLGRIILLADAFLGMTFLGIVIWVIQYCLGEPKLKESQKIF